MELDAYILHPPNYDPKKVPTFVVRLRRAVNASGTRHEGRTYLSFLAHYACPTELCHCFGRQSGHTLALWERLEEVHLSNYWYSCAGGSGGSGKGVVEITAFFGCQEDGDLEVEQRRIDELECIIRHPELYHTAMSIVLVPNQQVYDTIYQERYMGLPSDNVGEFISSYVSCVLVVALLRTTFSFPIFLIVS